MSGLQLRSTSAVENEYLAENTLIKMVPNFTHPKMRFISGDFGPFDIDVDVEVPLWLAITLRKKDKCKIVIPEWLRPEETVRNERIQSNFQPLLFHYMEVALLLLMNAREEIPEPDRVTALLQDLENIRMDRVRIGMQSVADSVEKGDMVNTVKLQNIGAIEVVAIKRFFLDSMGIFNRLVTSEASGAGQGEAGADNGSTSAAASSVPPGRALRRRLKT